MRHCLLAACLIGLALLPLRATSVPAQPPGSEAQPRLSDCAATPAAAERQILQLEDQWMDALARRDADFFERTLADDYLATGGPTVETKAQYLAGIRKPPSASDLPRAALTDTQTRLYNGMAVVTGLANYGSTPPRRTRYTEVFVCRGGRWQAVHGHYSRLRAQPAPTTRDSASAARER
jgi:hypothetical protein